MRSIPIYFGAVYFTGNICGYILSNLIEKNSSFWDLKANFIFKYKYILIRTTVKFLH